MQDKTERNLGFKAVEKQGETGVSSPTAVATVTHPHFQSPGEKIHKWATYLGVDWVYNAATGIAFVYWGKYTESGKKMWSGPITKGLRKAFKPMIEDPVSLEKSVDHGNTFISIIAGGMLTIPPLMALENNKVRRWFAHKYDTMLFGKEKVDNDPDFQAAYERMEHEPKKDFEAGMMSRFVALAPLLASVTMPSTRPKVEKYFFEPISRASEGSLLKMGVNPEGMIQKISPHISAAEAADRWRYVNDKAFPMELGFDIPYALMHKFWYDQFARMKGLPTGSEPTISSDDTGILIPKKNVPRELVSNVDITPFKGAEKQVSA